MAKKKAVDEKPKKAPEQPSEAKDEAHGPAGKAQGSQPKRKVPVKRIIIISSAVILVFIVAWIYLRLNMLIGDGVMIVEEPFYSSINLKYGESVILNAKTSLSVMPFCTAVCNETWSSADAVKSGNFSFEHTYEHESPFTATASARGYGKEIYQHRMECVIVNSNLCPSDGSTYRRIGTYVVNYGPSDEQLETARRVDESFRALTADYDAARNIESRLNGLLAHSEVSWNISIDAETRSLKEVESGISAVRLEWSANEYEEASRIADESRASLTGALVALDSKRTAMLQTLSHHNESVALAESMSGAGRLASFPGNKSAHSDILWLIQRVDDGILRLNERKPYGATLDILRPAASDYAFALVDYESAAREAMKDHLEVYVACQGCSADTSVQRYKLEVNRSNMFDAVKEQCSMNFSNISSSNAEILAKIADWKNASGTGTAFYDSNDSMNLSEYVNNRTNAIRERCRPEEGLGKLSVGQVAYNASTYDPVPETLPGLGATTRSHSNPLILLHGHSFNVRNSAFQSTEVYNALESALEGKGFVALGTPDKLNFSVPWGDLDVDAVFKPTYYITSYANAFGILSTQSKTQNIDSYALRLKEILDYAKHVTGKGKVRIIAHSMGGLVVRRYVQIYGSDDIEWLVMVGTPNQGIDEKMYKYCKLFGEPRECDDMLANSTFLLKLNDLQNQKPMPPTTLIIGRCYGEEDDGVVTAQSARLDGYDAQYFRGECSTGNLYHSGMLKDERVIDEIMGMIR